MAKTGSHKNTENKAKHTKLMNRKWNKKRKEKKLREEGMKALKETIKDLKSNQ